MTKWVFAALLAINAGYLAWGVLLGGSSAPMQAEPPATEPGVPPLVLLHERPAAEASPKAEPLAPKPAEPTPAAAPRSIAPPPVVVAPVAPMAKPMVTPMAVAPVMNSAATPAPQPAATSMAAPLPEIAATPLATPMAAARPPEPAPPPPVPTHAASGRAAPPAASPAGLPRPVRVGAAPTGVCYSFGPFPKSFLASKATVRLEEMGVKITRRGMRDRQQVGYWIYLPPQASKQAAVRKTQELAAKKVDDFFIVLASKYQNAISLGVYKNRNGAERRLAELREKGFEALMEPRYQPINVYWLDVGGHLTERQWNAVREEYPAQRRETVTCGG